MTTNGARLDQFATPLKNAGLSRLNISLDTLDADQFHALTRTGHLADVLRGIDAAQHAGFAIKLNVVMMKGRNDDQILPLVRFARDRGFDLSFIEEMPLGVIDEHSRQLAFMASDDVRAVIASEFNLTPSHHHTRGPSRYWSLANSDTRIGFISPHSHNFCGDCNRVRVTSEGRLLLCLGNEIGTDLLPLLRADTADDVLVEHIQQALLLKPEKHHFDEPDAPQILRFMNMTGG